MLRAARSLRAAESSQDPFTVTLAGAVAGEAWAFEQLYGLYGGRILAFARARKCEDPEVIANETMLRAFQNIAKFEGTAAGFQSWIFSIARNKIIDAHRAVSRRPLIADAEPSDQQLPGAMSAEVSALQAMSLDRAHELLSGLTEDQREVVALRMISDLSLEQVAAVTDKPVTAVKALQRRGLRRLEKQILHERSLDG